MSAKIYAALFLGFIFGWAVNVAIYLVDSAIEKCATIGG